MRTATRFVFLGLAALLLSAGITKAGTIGDRVWLDANSNGIQDTGEGGVYGVTVQLYTSLDVLQATKTTSATGYFSFTNVAAGTYYLKFTLPSGYAFVAAGATVDEGKDSDVTTLVDGTTDDFTITAIQTINYMDAGMEITTPYSIGDLVWIDKNANGIMDVATETGLSGVTVKLYNNLGTVELRSTVTNASGAYAFDPVIAGDYVIKFISPSGYYLSAQGAGADVTIDSDADPATGKTGVISVSADVTDIDAGMFKKGSIGDRVWFDDGDGILESTEAGFAGVTVKLLDAALPPGSTPLATKVTSSTGYFTFTGLSPEKTYVLQVILPAGGYVFSPAIQGTDNTKDSDILNLVDGYTNVISITSGQVLTNIDAAINLPGSAACTISDFVWNDMDADGKQEVNEPGITGVSVKLYKSDGVTLVKSTTTTTGGLYSFTNVIAGDYLVKFAAPSGYFFSPKAAAADVTLDSDVNPGTGKTDVFTMAGGATNSDIDAGMYKKGSIGDRAWMDDGDGILEAGEAGFAGVTVNLYAAGGAVVLATKTTSATGYYSFTGLAPGTYDLEYVLPSGDYDFAPVNAGGDEAKDSDVDVTTGKVEDVVITSGLTINNLDAGVILDPAVITSISDKVWIDANGDGIQDVGEAGLAGVTVKLYNSTGSTLLTSTTTAVGGTYSFGNLLPNTYVVRFTAPSGYYFSPKDVVTTTEDLDSDADATGKTAPITLAGGVPNDDIDAGLYKKGSIGDRVWNDLNRDGILDTGEPGFAGVTVELYSTTDLVNKITSKVTSTSGYFVFSGLVPGSYKLKFIKPVGDYLFSADAQGTDPAKDCDVVDADGWTDAIIVTSGLVFTDKDAGIHLDPTKDCSISDFVWVDTNANGIQDAGELGLDGVSVKLYNSTGTTLIKSTTTANGGLYSFTLLPAGTYIVKFTCPSGYYLSPAAAGAAGVDSDPDPVTGKTAPIILAAADEPATIDAGMFKKGTIGDRVWNDLNLDGLLDATEKGFPGVTVKLYASGDLATALQTKVTGSTGYYSFTGVVPGTYVVQYVLPSADYLFSPDGVGTDEGKDSDVIDDVNGYTDVITITSGLVINNQDAGIYIDPDKDGSIANLVWVDTNADGIQDAGESGLANVSVRLYNESGTTLIATTTTGTLGTYIFEHLPPANYLVKFTCPTGYYLSPKGAGADVTKDSDADPVSGKTATITVGVNADLVDIDAGMFKKGAIGDRVWIDADGDGVLETGETGFSGALVNLYASDGTTLLNTKLTGSTGYFTFDGLTPGTYVLGMTPPAGYSFTDLNAAAATEATDSDFDPATSKTAAITIVSGQIVNDQDAGITTPGPVSPFVRNPFKSGSLDENAVSLTEFKAYPNPFSGNLNISFRIDQDTQVSIAIMDMSGRVVEMIADRSYEAGQHNLVYTNQSLKAGVYFMRITHNGGSDVMRIVVSD